MKKIYLLAIGICCASYAFGQKTEYAAQLNTGLTTYRTNMEKATAMVSYPSDPSQSFTYQPFGSSFTLSYGLSGQIQRITKDNLIFGGQVAYESLRSKMRVVDVYEKPYQSSGYFRLYTGYTYLNNHNLNLHPYIGYRKNAGSIDMDISVGSDFGYVLELREKGMVTADDGSAHTTDKVRDENEVKLDIRPRVNFTAYRSKVGVAVSYSHGLSNYMTWFKGADLEAYTRIVRIGLVYRI